MDKDKRSADCWQEKYQRLLDKDTSLWPDETPQDPIANRLGWLDAAKWLAEHLADIEDRVAQLSSRGYDTVVLLGMGGSSLAAEALVNCGRPDPRPAEFIMLDTSSWPRLARLGINVSRSLFIVASKSGTTVETITLQRYFFDQVARNNPRPGDQFIAISDPDSALCESARSLEFLEIFENPPHIGGRFSALSYFGLIPSALVGVDVRRLGEVLMQTDVLSSGGQFAKTVIRLSQYLVGAAADAYPILNICVDSACRSLFGWIEQLVAESLGKGGTGVLPILHRNNDPPVSKGRLIRIHAGTCKHSAQSQGMTMELDMVMPSPAHLGIEFLRWEMAVALAASELRINPFDQPDVESAKRAARELMCNPPGYTAASFSPWRTEFEQLWFVHASSFADFSDPTKSLEATVEGTRYIALLAYLPPCKSVADGLNRLAGAIETRWQVPVTVGYGPGYLHSTGQFHKGGPATGSYLFINDYPYSEYAEHTERVFRELHRAQSEGDASVLAEKQRPVMRLDLKGDRLRSLAAFTQQIRED